MSMKSEMLTLWSSWKLGVSAIFDVVIGAFLGAISALLFSLILIPIFAVFGAKVADETIFNAAIALSIIFVPIMVDHTVKSTARLSRHNTGEAR